MVTITHRPGATPVTNHPAVVAGDSPPPPNFVDMSAM
jgi:hypothetical protein